MAVDPAQAASSTPAAPPPKLLHRHPADWTAAALQALQHCGEYPSHRCWLELFEGDADSPLVICAPHDGTLRPPQLSVRQSGTSARDTGTKGLAAALALEVLRRGGRRPTVLVCHLSRKVLDVNRPREQAACAAHVDALCAWEKYHALQREAAQRAAAAAAAAPPRHALLLDVHAQAHHRHSGIDAIELGTLRPSASDLGDGLQRLEAEAAARLAGGGAGALVGLFSMPRLAAAALARGITLRELLVGEGALGSRLCRHGFLATPSNELPVPPPAAAARAVAAEVEELVAEEAPAEAPAAAPADTPAEAPPAAAAAATLFFSGATSYPLSVLPEVIDAVQLECPIRLCAPQHWKPLARSIACAVDGLVAEHCGGLGVCCAGAPPPCECPPARRRPMAPKVT